MSDYMALYFEYEFEFGTERAQTLLFIGEELSEEDVIRRELAAEYMKNPAKEHLRKYARDWLEEDLWL